MSANFQLNAVARESKGTSVSRKLRRAGQVPAMVYGAGKDNQQLLLNSNEIKTSLGIEAFHSAIISLNTCLLYTSPSPRDRSLSRMPSSA